MKKIIYSIVTLALLMISASSYADGICTILKQHPSWLQAVQDTAKKWGVPAQVQLAIIKEESNFNANAKNPQSTATGFAQVLNKSWLAYVDATDSHDSRTDFRAAIDYIGWYANQVRRSANVSPTDAYSLYLAYHEGIGGYLHLASHPKPEVTRLAENVEVTATQYAQQMVSCTA